MNKDKSNNKESDGADLVQHETLTENGYKEAKKKRNLDSSKNSGNHTAEEKKKKKRESKKGAILSDELESDVKRGGNQVEEEGGKKGGEVGEGPGGGASVIVYGNNTSDTKYKALGSFVESGLPAEVLDCCKNCSTPSPIQSHAWPFLLDGRYFIGISANGSGKTLAFGVPALMHSEDEE